MKTTHTPGPWHVMPYNYVCNVPQRARIHAADGSPVVDDANPSMEDARLMASAPDLLEALQAIVAYHHGDWDNPALVGFGPLSTDSREDMIAIAEAAIAKATGSEVGK